MNKKLRFEKPVALQRFTLLLRIRFLASRIGFLLDCGVLACDFHHDPSELHKFRPDSADFFDKLDKAQQDCEDEIEESRIEQCIAEKSKQRNLVANPFYGFCAIPQASDDKTACSSSTSDPNFKGNPITEEMSWSRFPFQKGSMPPPFPKTTSLRSVTGAYISQEQGEGAGARVRRSIGRPELRNMDPFLMLDEFKVGLPAGFPDHPHRGIETVTYMFPDSPGNMTHEDSNGNAGTLGPQDLQWMTAARGILHSEVPDKREPAHGLQMWLNLKSKDKMIAPEYQEFGAADLTRIEAADDSGKLVQVALVAGESLGGRSKIRTRTPCYMLHVKLTAAGAVFRQMIPPDFTAFLYTLEGAQITLTQSNGQASKLIQGHTTVTLESNGKSNEKMGIEVIASKADSDFVLVAAQPIGEPIVQHGPFVMTSQNEIRQAFMDYQNAANGFESARGWESKNRRLMGR